jgi:hypothetical protein
MTDREEFEKCKRQAIATIGYDFTGHDDEYEFALWQAARRTAPTTGRILDRAYAEVCKANEASAAPETMWPVAWISTVQIGGGPEDPPDFDVVCVAGDTPPDNRNKWTPLYTDTQLAAAREAGIMEGLETAAKVAETAAHRHGGYQFAGDAIRSMIAERRTK